MLMKIHTSYDEYRIQRLKHQPHAVQNITLMSSICKLPKAIASSAVVGAICTAILSRFDSGCRCYHGHGGRHHHHHRAPQQHQQQSQHEHNSNQSTNCRHAHNQQTVPSHQRIVVKPNFLATNLVNTLMISLYITLFISIAVHPVVVNAVGEYYTDQSPAYSYFILYTSTYKASLIAFCHFLLWIFFLSIALGFIQPLIFCPFFLRVNINLCIATGFSFIYCVVSCSGCSHHGSSRSFYVSTFCV